jgi:hypothetical protein
MAKIGFKDLGEGSAIDAFSGGPLLGKISQCKHCLARYGEASLAVIEKENFGICVACNKLFNKLCD